MAELANDAPQSDERLAAEDMAARLAARLLHDLMSPASGVVSGIDLIEDPHSRDLHAEAMALIVESGRRLEALLTFCRAAYSPAAAAGGEELERLARRGIAGARAALDWTIERPVSGAAARVLLHLVQIAAAAAPLGGRVRAGATGSADWSMVSAEAIGERLTLHPDVAAGLRGERAEGAAPRWIQPYWLHAHVAARGGLIAVEESPGTILFRAALPAGAR